MYFLGSGSVFYAFSGLSLNRSNPIHAFCSRMFEEEFDLTLEDVDLRHFELCSDQAGP